MGREIADVLNAERIMSARGVLFRSKTIHLLRKQWGIRAAKINGVAANQAQWPDGSYSVWGAAEAVGIVGGNRGLENNIELVSFRYLPFQ